MAEEIIKARVWTKIDTLEAWDANPLILGPGEFAPVLTGVGGSVFNFKVGTGDRRFSDLPWSLQNPGAAIAADTNTAFPSGVPGLYIPTESGDYDGVTVDLEAGYTQLIWDGTTLVKVEFPIDLAGYTPTSEFNPVKDVVDNRFGVELIDRSLITKGAWNMTGSSKSTSNNWISSAKISVLPSTTYTVSGLAPSLGGSNPGVVLFGPGGTPPTRSLYGGQTPFVFTTAADEYFVGVNIQAAVDVGLDPSASLYYHSASLVEGDLIKFDLPGDKIFGEISTPQIEQMESGVNALFSLASYSAKTAGFAVGGITTAGTTVDTSNWRRTSVTNTSAMFQVATGEALVFTGEIVINSPAFVGVAYYDENLSFLGYQCDAIGVYNRFRLTLPEGTLYIGSCSYVSDPIIESINIGKSDSTFHVSASASPEGDGTPSAPFNTISEAISAAAQTTSADIVVWEGDYRESLALDQLPSGSFSIMNREGHRVRVLGSNQMTGWVKTSGRTNVYDIAFSGTIPTWSRYDNPIFEDGRPSKPVDPNDYHPLQKNLQFRLPFTPIVAVGSIDLVDSTPGSYHVTGGRLYLHTSDSDSPTSNGYSYENIVRSANGINSASTTTKKTNLHLKGLQFFYNTEGLRLSGFNDCLLEMVVSLGTPAAGAICPNTGNNTLIYCEAGFCNGDGFNGHFSSYTGYASLADNRSNYPTTKYIACWAHDNFDDGESSHEQHNVFMDSCLSEFNGDSGCRPSNDATYYVKDTIFRHNGWEVVHGGTAAKGEGFAVVNPALNPARLGCRAILFNCLSYGNNTGYGTISQDDNRIELINCQSRNNTMAEYYAGQGEMVLRNCRATNADPAKIKVVGTGTISVENDTEVV